MAEAKIFKCKCISELQDKLFGKNNRLFNPAGKGKDQGTKYRCTICGNTISGR